MQQTFIDLVTEKYLMINRPRQQGEICTKCNAWNLQQKSRRRAATFKIHPVVMGTKVFAKGRRKGYKALLEGARMSNKKLNREDQELLEAFEAGEFVSDLKDERRTQLARLAEETIRKDK
jgi:hypothetical protein